MDMWAYLPMFSLFIRVIVANSEIDDTALSSKIGLASANDNVSNGNHTGKPSIDAWKMSKKERNKREIDPNVTPTDEMKVNADDLTNPERIVPKGRETAGAWFIPTRKEGFEEVSQERTSPWRWWPDEKRDTEKPTLSCECKIRGKYRHAYDGGGNKRGAAVYASNVGLKRMEAGDDRNDRDKILNEFNGIKRQELRKAAWRWDKWGGKRAEISDRERILLFLKNPDVRILNVAGDELPKERAVRIKDKILTTYGKRDSNPDDEANDDERINEIDDWLSTRAKKTEHGQHKKTKFNPWGGKRSVRVWNDYVECMLKTINRDLNP